MLGPQQLSSSVFRKVISLGQVFVNAYVQAYN